METFPYLNSMVVQQQQAMTMTDYDNNVNAQQQLQRHKQMKLDSAPAFQGIDDILWNEFYVSLYQMQYN
jgi:hypothetical protein